MLTNIRKNIYIMFNFDFSECYYVYYNQNAADVSIFTDIGRI